MATAISGQRHPVPVGPPDVGASPTGHDQLSDALERLLWIEPNPRVLTVVGEPGAGTSTALARAAVEAEQGYRVVRVDLGQVLADDAIHGRLGDDPALRLTQTLAVRIAALAPGWRRGALAKEASDLDDLPDDLDVVALSGGVETLPDSPLTVRVGDEREGVRRRWWLAGLTEVARRLRRSRFVLVIDEAQLLGVFDPVQRADRVPGAAFPGTAGDTGTVGEHLSWFAGQLLPALLDTAPHLRVILGGTSRVPVGAVPADQVTLRPWTAVQTATYLGTHGYDDAELARAVHEACGGSPLVTAALARHVLPAEAAEDETGTTGETPARVDAKDVDAKDKATDDAALGEDAENPEAETAGDAEDEDGRTSSRVKALTGTQSVAEWLPKQALSGLDDADRELLAAAATLRVVSDPALRALCPDAAADDARLARLRAEWSSDTYDDAAGTAVWRMHPLLRSWLLGHFETTDRTDTGGTGSTERHRAAAEYYESLDTLDDDTTEATEASASAANARFVEAAYHRFAAGDDSRAAIWRDELVSAVHGGRLGRAHALASAALAARPSGQAAAGLAPVWPVATLATAYAAYLRGDLVEADALTAVALDEFDALASDKDALVPSTDVSQHRDRLRALEIAGQLDWLAWRCRDAAHHWLDAVEVCRGLDDPAETLAVLCAAGEASLACGELLVADDVLDEAYSLFDESPDGDDGEHEHEHDESVTDTGAATDAVGPTGFPRVPLGTLGEVDDDVRSANLLRWLGETAAALGETERAEVLLDQAQERASAAGHHRRLLADILRLKAQLASDGDDLAASEALLERAHATARGCPDRASLAQILLAQAALERRLAEAARTGEAARTTEQPTDGDKPTDVEPADETNAADAKTGTDPGEIPGPAAVPALERLSPAPLVGTGPATDADVAVRHRQRRAAHLASAALDLAHEFGHAPVQAAALALTGDYDEALALTRRLGDRRGEVLLAIDLGIQAQEAGDSDTARTYFSAAAEVADEIGDSPNADRARRGLADLGDPEPAS